MSKAFVQRLTSRVDDICRSIEIWLADFEMNDIATFRLQRPRS